MNPSTQALYRSAVMGLYIFASKYLTVEIADLIAAKRQYSKRQGVRLPNFDREAIEKVISYCEALGGNLIALRDRAIVLTLADTGLRLSEACSLRRATSIGTKAARSSSEKAIKRMLFVSQIAR